MVMGVGDLLSKSLYSYTKETDSQIIERKRNRSTVKEPLFALLSRLLRCRILYNWQGLADTNTTGRGRKQKAGHFAP